MVAAKNDSCYSAALDEEAEEEQEEDECAYYSSDEHDGTSSSECPQPRHPRSVGEQKSMASNLVADRHHIVVKRLSALLNHGHLDWNAFEHISCSKIFRWVAVYVVTTDGHVVLMESSSKKKSHLHAFGGSDAQWDLASGSGSGSNFWYSFLKLRSELLDEAAINLEGASFSSSPLIFVRDGIAQVVCLSPERLAPEQLWCPEIARKSCDGVHLGISVFCVRLASEQGF